MILVFGAIKIISEEKGYRKIDAAQLFAACILCVLIPILSELLSIIALLFSCWIAVVWLLLLASEKSK
jgi:uncharacterized membrane protein